MNEATTKPIIIKVPALNKMFRKNIETGIVEEAPLLDVAKSNRTNLTVLVPKPGFIYTYGRNLANAKWRFENGVG